MKKSNIQKMSKKCLLALLASLPAFGFSQTNVTANTSAIAMAQAIVGTASGVTVSSASFSACGGISPTGTVIAAGTFTNTSGDLGIANGIVLTTGSLLDVGKTATYNASKNLGYTYSDPDLVAISAKATYDVCALTFTFVPVCSALNITFVFGSEEYPKYECDSYNDVFGIFLSGANPAGGNYAAKNIATLPNGIPVSIDNVNDGNALGKCATASNPTYYHDNYTVPNTDVVYNGYTLKGSVPITSTTSVTPCSTYVMKIAIADAGTGLFDSGVFIQGSSVDCAAPATVSATATKDSCGKNNGTAKVVVTNFSGVPTYSWSPGGQTTAGISGLSPGTYTCVVGLPSCSTTNTQTVTATITAYGAAYTPTVTAINTPVCSGTSTTLTASGATGGTYTWTPGSITTNTLAITGSNSGNTTTTNTVSVIATNTLGCIGTTGYTLTVLPTPTITLASPTYTVCSGISTSFSVSSSASSYSWNAPSGGNITGGSTTATPTTIGTNTTAVATALIYTVTGTLGTCTSTAKTVTLTVNPLPSITVPNDSICAGGFTGTLTASGTANTYTWNTGITGSTFTVANVNSNTSYTVIGTISATTCSNTATGNIIVRNPVKLNASPATICPGTTATLTASGAGPGGTYVWNTGATTASTTVSPASSTNYTVTGTDAHGCFGSNTASVTVSNSSSINVTSTKAIICSGITDTLNAIGAVPGTYTWTASDGTILSGNSAQIAITQTTSVVTYTVAGSSGGACIVTPGTITVTVQPAYTISIASSPTTAAVCPGGTLTLNGSPASTYTYTWSGGITDGTSFAPLSSQNYTVTATDVNGCQATATQNVTVYPKPTISIAGVPSLSICTGATTTLTATSAPVALTSYTWSTGSSNDTIVVTPSVSTPYTVTATDGNGCIGTQTTSVIVTTNVAIHISVTHPIACPGVVDTLIAHGATTYSWAPSGSIILVGISDSVAIVTLTGSLSPTYTVIGYQGGCQSQTYTFNVNVDPTFTVNAIASPTNAAVCLGDAITLSGNGAGTYTYTFTGGINNGQSFVPSFSGTPQSYTLTGTNANGCIATNTIAVTVNALPTVTITPISACAMGTATLTANSTSTITSYTWNNTTPATTNTITVPIGNSTQSYTVVATDNNGCVSAVSSTTVGIYTPVAINITSSLGTSVCASASNTLTALGTGISTYTWNSPSIISNSITVTQSVPTSYTVLGTDGNGCIDSSSIAINISPLPIVQIPNGNDIICLKATNTFSVSPINGVNYYWTGPAPSTATVSTGPSVGLIKGGTYVLNAVNNCGATQSTFTLTTDSVKAIFTPNTPITGQVPVSVTFTNNSQGNGLQFNWNFGNGNSSIAVNPTEHYTSPGIYQTLLTATDNSGCKDTMSVKITVNDVPTIVIIPNIFTPNGDNINDEFAITATGVTNFDCKVYDRWGILLHEWTGVDGGWDGKGKSGANCPDGTYFYLISYTDNKGKSTDKDGFFQLIR